LQSGDICSAGQALIEPNLGINTFCLSWYLLVVDIHFAGGYCGTANDAIACFIKSSEPNPGQKATGLISGFPD
jgi:hypothetical protein